MITGSLVACICEGAAERAIINKLIDEHKLIFERSDLLDKEVLRCRNAREFEDRYLGKGFNKKITVFRILDSRRENFKLRAAYKDKVDVINIITAPEIEMLVIISEDKYAEYSKVKSSTKPSDFCKNQLKMPKVKSTSFVIDYFQNTDILIAAINKYKSLSRIPKNEKCLVDLLREDDR